jgi:putative endonuclease
MYYTYILKSLKTGSYYYGYTKDLTIRLNRHNEGHVRSTKSKRMWIIHYFEKFENKSDAIKRELFFKSIDGYNWLRDEGIILKTIAVPSGKTVVP